MKVFYERPHATLLQGHVLDVLAQLAPESVQCIVTSPPYWQQRVYPAAPVVWGGWHACQHRWHDLPVRRKKAGPDWAERRPQDKQSTSLGTVWEVPHGRLCERCDAWEGSLGCEPTPSLYMAHLRLVARALWRVLRPDGLLFLNLGDSYVSAGEGAFLKCLPPRLVESETLPPPKSLHGLPWRVALALVADGWCLRNDIVWHIPNALPESVRDRFSLTHEYLFMFSKEPHYYFDAIAVREPAKSNGSWRNRRTLWSLPHTGGVGDHHAVFPESLAALAILAGTSAGGACRHCGAPFARNETLGWVATCACGHDAGSAPCLVLDPFVGSGTTCVAACRLGRAAVGIDIATSYLEIAARRLAALPASGNQAEGGASSWRSVM